jgi:MFS family permease
VPGGIILSNLVFLLASIVVTPEQFAAWAWRIPFLASAVLVVVGLYVRLGLSESPVFVEVQKARGQRRRPVVDVLRTDARTVLLAAGSYIGISGLGYIVIVYFVSYATTQLGVPLTTVLALLLLAAVVFSASIVAFASWSDYFGRRRIMNWGCGGMVLWSVVFFPLANTKSIPLIGLALCGMLLLQGAYMGPQPAVFSELFPASTRYSGASLSLTLATIFGGALAPFIATALFGLTNNSQLVTLYAVALSLISWVSVLGLKETYRRDLSFATVPGDPQ